MTEEVHQALEVLRKGGVILYPTDTIWGIGCDATREDAVKRIYGIKQREDVKSMLVLLDHPSRLAEYVEEVPDIARELLQVADKPLTIIYPGARNMARNLIAPDGTIGIRIVQDEFCQQLIHLLGNPLVSTSANTSGMPWPSSFQKIEKSLLKAVDYVVKWRQHQGYRGKPSGIIKIGLRGEVQVIRE